MVTIYYRYKQISALQSVLASLRPAVVALIASAGLSILNMVVFGGAEIRLENVDWEKFDLSVFHDENENWQMDMLEGKGPAEGYVLKSCEVKDEEATFKLKLYYPVNQ